MLYEDGKKLIKQNFSTYKLSLDIEIILIDKSFDYQNNYFLALIKDQGEAKLTDMGKLSEIKDLELPELEKLSSKYNLELKGYVIEKKLENIEDVNQFIALFDEASEM